MLTSYKSNELHKALERYLALEKDNTGKVIDAVMVSAESVGALKLAFPNYYLDTDLFLQAVEEVVV